MQRDYFLCTGQMVWMTICGQMQKCLAFSVYLYIGSSPLYECIMYMHIYCIILLELYLSFIL